MEASNAPKASPEPPRPLSLAPHLAILGFVGAWMTADILCVGNSEGAIRWLLILMTPLVSAGLGRYLATRLDRGILGSVILIVTSVAVAGIINGILVGFFIVPPLGMILGVIFGFICSVPFMPAIGLCALAARRAARARASSIVARADHRAVWVVTCVILSLAAAVGPIFSANGTGPALIPAASLVVLLGLLALDVIAFVRAGAIRRHIPSTQPIPAEALPDRVAAGVPAIDLGLGDEIHEEIAAPGPVYRDRERSVRVIRGSADRARAAIGWAITTDIAAILVAVGCLVTRYGDLLRFPADLFPSGRGSWV